MNETVQENVIEKEERKIDIDSAIVEAFEAGIEAEKEEDNILIAMLQAGAPFNSVRRMYNELMIEAGYVLSKEDQEAILKAAFEGRDLDTEQGFDAAVADVNAAIDYINEKQAINMVRAWARKNEIKYFKKPKGVQGKQMTFTTHFYDALVENPRMSAEQVKEFIADRGTENTSKWEKQHQKVRELVNRIADKYIQ